MTTGRYFRTTPLMNATYEESDAHTALSKPGRAGSLRGNCLRHLNTALASRPTVKKNDE